MYKQPYPNLLKPLKIGNLTVKNRIMSAPNMLFHTVDGRPTDYYISYLEHKARGGAGIVTLGEADVCDGGSHTPWMETTIDNLPLYGEMAAAIHEHGAVACVELTHGGIRVKPQYNKTDRLIGPVDTVNQHGAKINAMTKKDMEYVANAFADATEYYLTAGFDTVLLHYAHGWLFSQFFSPITNTRTDEYGGSWENRIRFPMEVLKTVRGRIGAEIPVTMRLSGSERHPDGFSVEDIIVFLEHAQEYIDMAEISVEDVTNFFTTPYRPLSVNADLSEAIKKSGKINIPIYTLGAILSPEQSEQIISEGRADGVSMSRALIADPYLPKKAMDGRSDEIRPCLRCLNCTDSDNLTRHFVCSVNPFIAREARIGFADTLQPAKYRKKVLIVGGGPAGMQAAITAADRGHEVALCEKTDVLGGLLGFTDTDSFKTELRGFKAYLINEVRRRDIKVMLGTEVTDELLETMRPDNIIVATGAVPVTPGIKGIEHARHVLEAYYTPEVVSDGEVVIIGGGLAGVETGMHLVNTGKKVTILEMRDDYAVDAKTVYRFGLVRMVKEYGLNIITGAECREVTADGVVKYVKDGAEQSLRGDTVLYAAGMKSVEEPYFDLYSKAPFVAQAGDCIKPGKVDGAIQTGFFAAMDVGLV